jgi:predicted dehydrogenase
MIAYRAALCGLGNIAWRFDRQSKNNGLILSHACAYQGHRKTTLVAGCSPDQSNRNIFRQTMGLPVYQSLADMLAGEKPDIVSICSPSRFHYEQLEVCLEHAVAMVWLEKPPALTLHEVNELLTVMTSGKSTVLVNYQRRYLPAYQELRRRFLSKALGTCRQIQATYSRGLRPTAHIFWDKLFFVTGDSVI